MFVCDLVQLIIFELVKQRNQILLHIKNLAHAWSLIIFQACSKRALKVQNFLKNKNFFFISGRNFEGLFNGILFVLILSVVIEAQKETLPSHFNWPPLYMVFLSLFRDNGITIQILMYQLFNEFVMFLVVLIGTVAGVKENIHIYRAIGIYSTFVIFVIQPLFYLNGDVNFRNRVSQKGLWKALKIELFQIAQTGQAPPL